MPPRSLTRNEEIEEEVGIEEEEEKEIEEKEGTDEKGKEEVHDLSKIADKAHYLMACCNDLR